ncbi:MAG: Gfo/Idh/MocA family oxidoreductase [Deltaproteobacteria bacterium]|nr:Gfo/Idh/MocA family oxidoreductase [Deltaproteobacteria bacterium]MCL5278194.1 Gfo/Idh/MocA family oxidoreductase [Deltaproteobacteria bacterium]
MKLRAGVVGAGYLGTFHCDKYSQIDGADLVAIADTDGEKRKIAHKRFGADTYADYRELYGRVDAVSVVVPTLQHYEVAGFFLRHGIPVLLEKPISDTVTHARRLVDIAEENSTAFQIGHLERFNSAIRTVRGMINRPVFIEVHRLSPFTPRGTDVDVVRDLMIHDLDIILSLIPSDVVSIDAVGVPVLTDKIDIANARLKFKNGCAANITASRVSAERMRKIRLFQRDTYFSIDYGTSKVNIVKIPGGPTPELQIRQLEISREDSLLEEIKSFVHAVTTKSVPVVTGKDGLLALETAFRILAKIGKNLRSIGYEKGADNSR